MRRSITEADEGKRVVNGDGEEVGIVSSVQHGRVYVDPDPNVVEKWLSRLGWGGVGSDNYTLDESDVEEVTDDVVRLED